MAFQCRNVWKDIFKSREFCNFNDKRFLARTKVDFIEYRELSPKTFMLSLGNVFNIPIDFWLTFHILGLEPFSGSFSLMMFFSKSMSVHNNLFASPDRIAVSFKTCRNVAVFLPEPEIRASNSCSFGMNGNLRMTWHFWLFPC